MKISPRFVVAVSMSLALGWSAATLAAPSRVDGFATKTVRFGDLDLSTAVGAQMLYERLTVAARIVCRSAPHAELRACRNTAVDDAVRTIGSPLLSSIHRSTADGIEEVVLR